MDFISNLLAISQPTGVWATIINAFESGVGSYLLAIVLITLIVRVILAPFDTINKRITKKQNDAQAKLRPELEKIQKKYANDNAMLQQKQKALYKKAGIGMGGSCLFMLIFLAINLTVFFTLFSTLNGIADYKINQQYLALKSNYSNSLNLMDKFINDNPGYAAILSDYENLSIRQEKEKTYLYQGETKLYEIENKEDFTEYTLITTSNVEGSDITNIIVSYNANSEWTELKETNSENYYYVKTENVTKNEDETYTLAVGSEIFSRKTSDEYIYDLVRVYVDKETVKEGETPKYTYLGDTVIIDNEGEENDVKLSNVIKSLAMPGVIRAYDETQKENSFLWVGSIWIADSPFKSSIFTFDQYKKEIGEKNVSAWEGTIYNSFMNDLRDQKGRVNGYFILAIISMGLSFLSVWLGQLGTKPKEKKEKKEKFVSPFAPKEQTQDPSKRTNWLMMVIMPVIMGIFAILYNSVFAIYLIASQAISAALVPLNNVIIKAWDKHDKKKEESKQPVVDYRRK